MLTPQSNTTISQIAKRLTEFQTFAICGHVNPDGDCLGSELALAHALQSMGKSVTCLLATDDPIEDNLMFLPGIKSLVPGSSYLDTPDVFIAVDVPTRERLKTAAEVAFRSPFTITIDHHANPVAVSDLNYVDPDSPSASMLIWELIKELGEPTYESALCALTGLITDTGRFSYQNTTPQAFIAASEMVSYGASPSLITKEFFQNRSLPSLKLEQIVLERLTLLEEGQFSFSYLTNADFESCGAIKADAESLIDTLRGIRGVRVALILKESKLGEVRGSLRAKDNTDVSAVARFYDGGGHKAAAGFTYKGTIEEAVVDVPALVVKTCFTEEGQ